MISQMAQNFGKCHFFHCLGMQKPQLKISKNKVFLKAVVFFKGRLVLFMTVFIG